MSNSPTNVCFPLSLSIALCFFIIFLTPTHAQTNPTLPDLTPKPISNSHSTSPASTRAQKIPEVLDLAPKTKSNLTSPVPTHAQKIPKVPNLVPQPISNSYSTSHAPTHAQNNYEVPDIVPKLISNSTSSAPTHAQNNPKSPNSTPKLNSTSHALTHDHNNPKSHDSTPKSNLTSHAPTHDHKSPKAPNLALEPKPKSNPTSSNTKPKPPKPSARVSSSNSKPNVTSSPYHFANHFCLSRRLDVRTTFCLQVLKSSPTSMNAKDNQALLAIAADMAMQFGNKTLNFLKKLSTDKTMKPNLKPVIEECLSAYEGYLAQYKMLVEEAKTEAQVASYDSELAKIEINRCAKALTKTWNDDINEQNKIAMDYAKLSQNIADSID